MRKLKLLFAALALLLGGANSASAYTTGELESAGWTKITTISQSDITDKYYVFVANDADLMLGLAASSNQETTAAFYQALANPALDAKKVWTLQANGENYAMRNLYSNSRQMQTEWSGSSNDLRWRTNDQTGSISWTGLGLTYDEGAWTLTSTQYSRPLGIYNNETGTPTEGKEIGANDAGKGQKFQIYAISRDDYWNLAASLATKAVPVNSFTGAISNQEIYNKTQTSLPNGWSEGNRTADNSNRTAGTGITELEGWASTQWGGNGILKVDYYQNIVTIPSGVYRLKAFAGQDLYTDQAADAASNGVIYISNGTNERTVDITTTTEDVTTSTIISDGTLKIGMRADGKQAWVHAKDFRLEYLGKVIRQLATALPANGAMVANKWYSYTVTVDGSYSISATTAANIVTTTDTEVLDEDATTSAITTGNDVALTAGDVIYYKSTTDNTLTIEANVKSYEVGSVTAQSIANGSYIGGLTTLVLTYGDAATNDGDASLAVIGSATATLKKGATTITTGTLTADNSAKTLTATFEGVELAANASDYSVVIPAGAFGYAGQSVNNEVTVSFNTGIIADGVYYFKKKGEYKYLTRGGNYGTETVTDNYGISFEASVQSDGTYYLKNVDHSLSANTAKYLNTYTDGAAYKWTIVSATGGYYLKFTDGKYLTTSSYVYNTYSTYNYQSGTTEEENAIVWEILSKTEYNTSLAAKKNAEITAIATAAGITATTLAELETALASDYGTTDMTSSISNPLCNSASGWTAVSYNGGSTYTSVDYHAPTIQIWNCTGGITQTIASLPEGLYKVTVNATWRPGNSVSATRAGNEANTTAWVYANDNITQLKGWYEGGGTINSTQNLIDNAASYLNTVYVYVNGSEDLNIGIAVPSFCEQNWCPIYNWTLTRFDAKPTQTEKDNLAAAIDAVDDYVAGFENGEYAPYTNKEAFAALAAAQAIDPAAASGAAVVAATTALTGATWTVNVDEVNAVCNGDFALSSNDGAMSGWVTDHVEGLGGSYHARAFVLTSGMTNYDNLAAFNQGNATRSCAYFRFDGTNSAKTTKYTYGSTTGYTMPLKTNTIYKLTAQVGGWGQVDKNFQIAVVKSNDENMIAQSLKTPTTGVNAGGSVIDYEMYFVVPAAGNYKLVFSNASSDVDNAVVVSNIELKSTDALVFADGSVPTYAPGTYPTVKITRSLAENKWVTAVYPFAISGVAGLTIANLDSYTAGTGALAFSTAAGASTANVPFLMRSNSDKSEISLTNVEVAAINATDATAGTYAKLKGVYASTDITNAEKNYVLKENHIYSVGTAGATIPAYRAYIQIADTNNAPLFFTIDGETTGINVVQGEGFKVNGEVYDLQGRKVAKPTKGMYIQNGRKVVIK